MQIYLLASLMVDKEKRNNNLLETNDALQLFRNYYIDLGNNNYSFCYLPEKIKIEVNKGISIKSFTAWDSIIIQGPLSIKMMIEYFKKKYRVIISQIFSGKSMLFNAAQDEKEKNETTIESIYENITKKSIIGKKFLIFEFNSKTLDRQEVLLPRIKYIINSK